MMEYPDGERATISLSDACQAYLESGIGGIITRARVERSTTSVRVKVSGTTGEGYITVGSNSYGTCTIDGTCTTDGITHNGTFTDWNIHSPWS